MSEVLPILGCLALFLLVLPVAAFVQARRTRKEMRQLWVQFAELTGRIARMEMERGAHAAAPASIAHEPAPVAPLVPAPGASAHRPPAPEPSAPATAADATPPSPRDPIVPPISPPPPPLVPPRPAAPVLPPLPPRAPRPPFDWESLISVRLFAWLGGIALFIGMGLFLQYSIQHNLIPPLWRVVIALLVGAAALAGGDFLRTRGDMAGQATSGAGVGILYASLFAAHARYALLSTPATFACMAAVTVVAGILAARRRAYIVAVLGLVGGFLTPYLLATHEDRPVALFLYVLLLDFGALALARRRGWLSISSLALAGSAILFAGWSDAHLDGGKAPWALGAAGVLAALFAGYPQGAEGAPGAPRREWVSGIRICASIGPLLLAFLVAGHGGFAISPAFLCGYLILLAVGAFLVGDRAGFTPLLPIAAAFSVAALAARVSNDLFTHRTEVLFYFALVPAGFLAFALARRGRGDHPATRAAAAISLAGGLLVLLRFLDLPGTAPVLPLWIFAAAHAAGLLAIATMFASGAWILASHALLFASLAGIVASDLAGSGKRPHGLPEILPLVIAPTAAFWALPFVWSRWRRDRLAWLSSALAPILHFPVLYLLAKDEWGSTWLGGVAIVCGAAALLALRRSQALLTSPEDRRFTAALFGALTLVFVTAAVPIVLDKQWITVAWGLEAAALAWLWRRVPSEGLVKAATLLAAACFVRLVFNPALWHYHARSGTPILNWYLYTFGICAVALLWTGRMLRDAPWAARRRVSPLLQAAAGVLLFMLVNIEIADFYSPGHTVVFRLSGGGLAEDVTYSVAWGVFAMILLALGISQSSKPVRAAALFVLLLTIGKVFLHDLWDLGALYRVGSVIGLAVALLAVSFLTQRFVFARERS
ncbi:MAG: DUF2339 domain-containing protein [Acidobacteriota bacterium]